MNKSYHFVQSLSYDVKMRRIQWLTVQHYANIAYEFNSRNSGTIRMIPVGDKKNICVRVKLIFWLFFGSFWGSGQVDLFDSTPSTYFNKSHFYRGPFEDVRNQRIIIYDEYIFSIYMRWEDCWRHFSNTIPVQNFIVGIHFAEVESVSQLSVLQLNR